MSITQGDPVLLRSFSMPRGATGLTVSGSGHLLFGTTGLSNGGESWNSHLTPSGLCEVAPGTSGLFGKMVQTTGVSPVLRGTVIAELQVEVETSGGSGSLTECVLVQPVGGERFLVRVADVEEVV